MLGLSSKQSILIAFCILQLIFAFPAIESANPTSLKLLSTDLLNPNTPNHNPQLSRSFSVSGVQDAQNASSVTTAYATLPDPLFSSAGPVAKDYRTDTTHDIGSIFGALESDTAEVASVILTHLPPGLTAAASSIITTPPSVTSGGIWMVPTPIPKWMLDDIWSSVESDATAAVGSLVTETPSKWQSGLESAWSAAASWVEASSTGGIQWVDKLED